VNREIYQIHRGICQMLPRKTVGPTDNNNSGSCASNHKGGFWYNDCYEVNINGQYSSDFDYIQRHDGNAIPLASSRMTMKRII